MEFYRDKPQTEKYDSEYIEEGNKGDKNHGK
jgi:hypothetical protein